MVARVWVIALLLGACVADDEPPPVVTLVDDTKQDGAPDHAAICAAAAELPASDPCSLVCDPDAFKARLLEDGMAGGNCYQLRCALTAELAVTVGVCLP